MHRIESDRVGAFADRRRRDNFAGEAVENDHLAVVADGEETMPRGVDGEAGGVSPGASDQVAVV